MYKGINSRMPVRVHVQVSEGKASLNNPFKHISNASMQFYTQCRTMSTVRLTFYSHSYLTFIEIIS